MKIQNILKVSFSRVVKYSIVHLQKGALFREPIGQSSAWFNLEIFWVSIIFVGHETFKSRQADVQCNAFSAYLRPITSLLELSGSCAAMDRDPTYDPGS